MKKLLYILIVALLSMTVVMAIEPTITAPKINADDWSGSIGRDRAWRWAIAMENAVESLSDPPQGTGDIFYVDSGVSNAGDGSSWLNAVATVEEAIALCTANQGDRIYVAEGHTESWTAAAGAASGGFDADIAGITILGVGQGDDRPTFTYADTDATCAVGAASVRFENLVFLAGISEVVAGVIVEGTGDNFTMYNCEFPEPLVSSYEFDIGIQLTTAANDVTIAYCTAYSADATGATHWINGGAGVIESLTIVNNLVYGEYSVAPIFSDQADLKTHVANNVVGNMTTGQLGIEFSGNATGWCYGNLVITDTVGASYDTGVMDGGGGLWADEDSSDTYPVPWTTNETGVNRWGASELAQIEGEATDAIEADHLDHLAAVSVADEIVNESFLADITSATQDWSTFVAADDSLEAISNAIAALSGFMFMGTADANAGGAQYFISSELTGFTDDYFNSGWTATVLKDNSGAGSAPEGEVRDITDYTSSNGSFIVSPAFSAQVTTSDELILRRYEEHDLTTKATLHGGSGNVYYVDSGQAGTPSTAETGLTWDGSFTTIALALAGATASNGDVIYVAAGHSETVADAQLTWNVAGVRIIGLGDGNLQPTIVFNHANASIDVTVADVYCENLKFETSIDDVLVGIDIAGTADGFHLKNCRFVSDAATDEFLEAIEFKAADADDVIIEGCEFYSDSTAAATEAIISEVGASDNTQIINNTFIGSWGVSAIWSSFAHTNSLIKGNVIQNNTTGQHCIELTAAWTGSCVDNTMYGDTIGAILDPGSLYCSGNTAVTSTDEAALPIPLSAVSSGIAEDDDGSNLERLEFLQNKVEDILAGIRMAGGSVGDVYYVDDGGSGGSATTWATASTTLDAGYSLCTANVGDIVFVAPAHDEDLGDAQVAMDVAGVTVIGIGKGDQIPQIVCNHANSSVDVTAAGNTIIGLNFHSTTAASAIGIDVDAGDFTMEDCLFTDAGDFEFAITVDLGATAENATIRNCRFESLTGTTGATSCIAVTGGVIDRLIVEDCHIWGDFDNAGIYSDQINTNALIKGNSITNNESSDHAIELSAATTGDLVDNMLSASTYGSVLDPGSMRCFGNKQCVGTDTGAEDIPLIAGKTYARAKLDGDLNASDNLFSVTGSPIIVKGFLGKCTVACGGATTLKIFCDADDTYDYDLSTSVDVDTVDPGGNLAFTSVINESVLTVQTVGASGSLATPVHWWVEEGMLESTVDAGGSTGDIEWYMIFTPVESGCEVIPQ
jgi:hypothetical protein